MLLQGNSVLDGAVPAAHQLPSLQQLSGLQQQLLLPQGSDVSRQGSRAQISRPGRPVCPAAHSLPAAVIPRRVGLCDVPLVSKFVPAPLGLRHRYDHFLIDGIIFARLNRYAREGARPLLRDRVHIKALPVPSGDLCTAGVCGHPEEVQGDHHR